MGMCVWEKKNDYKVLVGDTRKKTLLGRARLTWKIILKWLLRK
jgi:hypothetical protein